MDMLHEQSFQDVFLSSRRLRLLETLREKIAIVFNLLVITYLFVGGCGGGLLLVISLWSLLFHRSTHRSNEATKAFDDLKKLCYTLGLVLVVIAAACLVIDLGRPAYFYLLFIRPNTSVLSFGTFILTGTILLSFFLTAANQFFPQIPSRVKKVAEVLCVIFGLLLITYVGIFLQSMGTVPFWNSYAIPVLFILSALSTGTAIIFLVAPFKDGYAWLAAHTRRLHMSHRIILVLELMMLALLLGMSTLYWTTMQSVELLFSPDLIVWFVGGAIGLGIAVPLLADLLLDLTKRRLVLPLVSILCLFGGFCLRYCIVMAGAY